jgi:hypothetical protein
MDAVPALGDETFKYNGCNIHLKAVETLEKHT